MSTLKYVGLYPEIPGGTELDFSALKEEVKQYVTNVLMIMFLLIVLLVASFFKYSKESSVAMYKDICQMYSNKLCFCV